MRKTILAGVLAAGAIAVVAGTASTNSNTVQSGVKSIAGYNATDIVGATITGLDYGLSTDGSKIEKIDLKFQGDLTGQTIQFGFGDTGALQTCADNVNFASGVVLAGFAVDTTTVSCEVPAGIQPVTSAAAKFRLAVN
jgi:hypothetical protein